jgi:hypothetical protein
MDMNNMRKAGQALGAFFKSPTVQQFGKRVAFDAGVGLAANAVTSALNPPITGAINNAMQPQISTAIQPEAQASYVGNTMGLSAQQYQQAAIEHQRYLQKLSLIQAEKQPTEVIHQTRHDPSDVISQMYAQGISKRYV